MEINLPDLPDTDYILVPPRTIFYPPVAEIPYLDPVLLPSLEQVESGLGGQESSAEEEKASSTEEALKVTPETIPTNLPATKETLSSESVATFNIPFWGNAYTCTRGHSVKCNSSRYCICCICSWWYRYAVSISFYQENI